MKKIKISLNSNNLDEQLRKTQEYIEELAKSKKQYQQMLKDDPKKKEIMDFLKNSNVNSNWGIWFIRNYKKDPSIFNSENMQKLEHFAGMTHLEEINSMRFDKGHELEQGFQMLEEAEQRAIEKIQDDNKLVEVKGDKVIDLGDGWAWWDLGVGACGDESQAMGHCGNQPSEKEGDTILSLRKERSTPQGTLLAPHLTFISNNGDLGEMKGKANEKPKSKYHYAITKLLESDNVRSIYGGGHAPENNFSLLDLKDNPKLAHKYDEIINKNPSLGIDHFNELSDEHKELAKEAVKTLPEYRKLDHANRSSSPGLLNILAQTGGMDILKGVSNNYYSDESSLNSVYNSVMQDTDNLSHGVTGKSKQDFNDYMDLLWRITGHNNIGTETLDNLANIKQTLDSNTGSDEISSSLWKSHISPILMGVSGNSKTSSDALNRIYQDQKNLFTSNPETGSELAEQRNHGMKFINEIAANKSSSSDLLRNIYLDTVQVSKDRKLKSENKIISILANNIATDEQTLKDIATDAHGMNYNHAWGYVDRAKSKPISPATAAMTNRSMSIKSMHELIDSGNLPKEALIGLSSQEIPNSIARKLYDIAPTIEFHDDDILSNLASNKSTPKDILNKLADTGEKYIMENILMNPSSDTDIKVKAVNDIYDKDLSLDSAPIAAIRAVEQGVTNYNPHGFLEPEVIDAIAQRDELGHLNKTIARHPNATEDAIKNVYEKALNVPYADDPDFNNQNKVDILKNIATNPNTPSDLITDTYNHLSDMMSGKNTGGGWVDTDNIRRQVLPDLVGNPNISEDLVRRIFDEHGKNEKGEEHVHLLQEMGKAPNAPADLLDKLHDLYTESPDKERFEDSGAFDDLLSNPNLSHETFNKLFDVNNYSHAEAAAKNKNLPEGTIEQIWDKFGYEDVSRDQLIDEGEEYISGLRHTLAENANLSDEMINRVLKTDPFLAGSLVYNENVPHETKSNMVNHNSDAVRNAVYEHPDLLTTEQIHELAQKENSPGALESLMRHKNTSPETRHFVATNRPDTHRFVHNAILANPNVLPETLEHYSKHDNEFISSGAKNAIKLHPEFDHKPEVAQPKPQEPVKISMDSPTLEDDLNKVRELLEEKMLEKRYKNVKNKVFKIARLLSRK